MGNESLSWGAATGNRGGSLGEDQCVINTRCALTNSTLKYNVVRVLIICYLHIYDYIEIIENSFSIKGNC